MAVRRSSTTPSPSCLRRRLSKSWRPGNGSRLRRRCRQHCKFIGHGAAAIPLLKKAGISDSLDEGVISAVKADVAGFIKELGKLRLWSREPGVKHDEASIPVKP